MANVTFNDLPTRPSFGSKDFVIINSSDRTTLPEGKVSFSTLKTALTQGIIDTYYFFENEKNVTVKTNSTGDNTIIVNNSGNVIRFDRAYNKVFGSFQIECIRTGNVSLSNVLCQYDLRWIPTLVAPGVPRLPQYLLKENSIAINNTTVEGSSVQNIQTNSFVPAGAGNFSIRVKFTQNVPSAKAKVMFKLTLFQDK